MKIDDEPQLVASAAERTRTMHWEDPLQLARDGRDLSGREYLERIRSGALPAAPSFLLFGFELEEIGEGCTVIGCVPREYHYNRLGFVHGGAISALADSAAGTAVNSLLPRGHSYTTVQLNVSYVKSVVIDSGRLRAVGSVVHAGRRIATAEARIKDARGRLVAHASATCLLFGQREVKQP